MNDLTIIRKTKNWPKILHYKMRGSIIWIGEEDRSSGVTEYHLSIIDLQSRRNDGLVRNQERGQSGATIEGTRRPAR